MNKVTNCKKTNEFSKLQSVTLLIKNSIFVDKPLISKKNTIQI